MDKQKLLSLTRAVLAQPTAPFHEQRVAAKIEHRLAKCAHVKVRRDEFGNLIAHYRRGRSQPRYAFAAHMDHPGFVAAVCDRRKSAEENGDGHRPPLQGMEFLGGVPAEYLLDPKTKNFGEFAMWDLPACEVRDGKIYSRACDDLIGCVAIVAMFEELEKSGTECACVGVFTRAEEVGFVGAIKLAQSGLLPKSLTVISLETSAERPPAKMGDGPIIRVGDKTSIFDSAATAALTDIATRMKIPAQRCLMPGGTCEATAYQLYGYTSAALCIALGNYHNCGPEGKIEAEFVSVSDLENLVRFCAGIARETGAPADVEAALRERLEANVAKYARYF